MTDDLEVDTTPFCLEAIKEDEKAITFYTGFTSYAFNVGHSPIVDNTS